MSVKLWEELETAKKLIKDLERRVASLEKQQGVLANGKPRDQPTRQTVASTPYDKRAG